MLIRLVSLMVDQSLSGLLRINTSVTDYTLLSILGALGLVSTCWTMFSYNASSGLVLRRLLYSLIVFMMVMCLFSVVSIMLSEQ